MSGHLFDFLTAFPKKHVPADFFVTDVEDFCAKTKRTRGSGVSLTVRESLRGFFNWIISEKGYRLQNPANVPKRSPQRKSPPAIALEHLERLLQLPKSPLDEEILQGALRGLYGKALSHVVQRDQSTVRKRWVSLCRQAEVSPVRLNLLRAGYERLCMKLGEQTLGLLKESVL